jgi:hypothetical protein
MAEQLNLSINVSGNVEESLGSIKKQLREAQNEVAALSDKFGVTSKEAVTAAKRAAELKDRIGDAKALTEAFNPDAKFKALSSSLAGVAGGFSAVQGAIGLFGKENKELEKQLLKVQSAMALSQGLQSIGESVDAFKNLGTVIKTQVITAFSTLRGALMATGIGALTIGIGLLIANFEKVKKAVLDFIPGLGTFIDFIGDGVQAVTDFVGITSEADRTLEQLGKTTSRANEGIDQRIKLLTAQGGKEKEIYALQIQRNNNELNALRERLALTGRLSEEEQKRFRELKVENQVLEITEQNRIKKLQEKPKPVESAEAKAKRLQQEADKEAQDAIDRQVKLQQNLTTVQSEGLLNRGTQAVIATQMTGTAVVKINEDVVKASTDYAELKAKEKKETEVSNAMQTLDIISGIVDQNSVAGKGIAIAQAIINTYQGASKAIAQGGTFGPALAAVTIAAGLLNVKKIISTPIPSAKGKGSVGGATGGGGGSISSSSSAPIQPQAQQAQLTQLNQSSINAIGNQSMRAYVVETDVTSSQQRIAAIQQRARFN